MHCKKKDTCTDTKHKITLAYLKSKSFYFFPMKFSVSKNDDNMMTIILLLPDESLAITTAVTVIARSSHQRCSVTKGVLRNFKVLLKIYGDIF